MIINITDEQVDELINKLTRPTYILRMAEFGRPWHHYHIAVNNTARAKSCETRAKNARDEVRKIIGELLAGMVTT